MQKLDKTSGCKTDCGCKTTQSEYWQDVENKVLDPKTLSQEFPDGEFDSFSITKSRRSFLKIMGFSVTALPLTGCIKIPVKKAIPYLQKNDTVIPGVANWYASTWKGVPVLVKTREGRPIKIEGNDKSLTTFGGVDAHAQASVLSLYDSYRFKTPSVQGEGVEWSDLDARFMKEIEAVKASGKTIYLVTAPISSPSEKAAIKEFTTKFNAKHVVYSPVSQYSLARANEITHNQLTVAEYDFEKADVVVSFGADFLGTWGSNTVKAAKQYAKRRDVAHTRGMSKHIQVESYMTMTGSNADHRFTRSVKDQRNVLLAVLNELTGQGGMSASSDNKELVKIIVSELKNAQGKSLVISADTDIHAQVVVNKINQALNNYGQTVTVYNKPFEVVANDEAFMNFVTEMNAGSVGAALLLDVNPAYDYADSEKFKAGLAKVKTTLSFAMSESETSKLCKFVAPTNHVYESWSDTLVSHSELSFTQPVVQPLLGTRMAMESLLTWSGNTTNFYDYMKGFWAKTFFPKQSKFATADGFWNQALHDGVISISGICSEVTASSFNAASFAEKLAAIKYQDGLNIVTYQKVAIKDGALSNNPWLQETPDPITKATWDNYVMVSPADASAMNIKSGDVVILKSDKGEVTIPAIVQPGVAAKTVAVAVGYGRSVDGKVGKNLGGNAYPFNRFVGGSVQTATSFGTLTKTGQFRGLAQTQTHHSMEGRDIVREATFTEYKQNPKAGNLVKAKIVNIYPGHPQEGHQWAMAIDLNKCTGCSACIVSCNAENNIPVVGRQEVANRREMHWMRLDRYYKGDENQPEVMHMPMLCQHCENAPCENVCPVMATLHSSDGLNQQVYNRCVGTRYCANNCPYKVRRFNWFNYPHEDEMEKMVLNPDVVVRSRGVMEKCSMCVQRIQEGRLTAKKERRDLRDGDIKTACQQSCPSDAIVFGDKNDPNSKIAKYISNERNYVVLEELNVQPRVSYMTKIRNK
jgi:Fe-S-cluster-containing dehydrogenase component/anaerobic selenocysteine-containing dehydrogenase